MYLIHRPITLWDATRHSDQPHHAEIFYQVPDPFAVRILIPNPGGRAHEVAFSRALLIDGLEWRAGEGVVEVAVHEDDPDYIVLTLRSVAGGMTFYAERAQLEAFVDATFRLVPLGGELALARQELDCWLAEVGT